MGARFLADLLPPTGRTSRAYFSSHRYLPEMARKSALNYVLHNLLALALTVLLTIAEVEGKGGGQNSNSTTSTGNSSGSSSSSSSSSSGSKKTKKVKDKNTKITRCYDEQ